MAYHIYHMGSDCTWMELFQNSYPEKYNRLHFLPKVDPVVRTDCSTGALYQNFTIVPGNVYGRLPVDRESSAYLHFSCGEGDLMVDVPSHIIMSVLDGKRDLNWLRDIASYANMLVQDLYRNMNQWEDEDDDYDPIMDAWMSYWDNLEEFISEKMS